MNTTRQSHPDTVDCPSCGGYGYDGVDEVGCPFACYRCGTTGRVSHEAVEQEEAEFAAAQRLESARVAAERARLGVPDGFGYYFDDYDDRLVLVPPPAARRAMSTTEVDDDIPF